ncbi:3-deoxy-D-manno-octulosonic-acid transferase [Desulfacinum hydrothermale DSM 13146]|uniref:3-deoxy-D-manno-octulosonic acid transferase n=1 Tax=Desulfacinum hydrothermale DSM 13146 TaxID=1121390 RepID=A0A1W1XTM4_9BACT|nr:glycosyltransferase N-terminal domain-containing protein [Desulfacinum hydrothermale]SMC27214.1 3-deoxy-D-manno-octulosonic-acid transferase [Desulfacinum hydrothermale DSM 13146]
MDGWERRFWRQRLFPSLDGAAAQGCPRLWLHAASVGEVTGALAVIRRLRQARPQAALYLTVGTPQGCLFARRHVPPGVRVLPAPLDLPWSVRAFLTSVAPDLFVVFESEFWPVLHGALRRNGVPVVLLNGRLSQKSLDSYRRFPAIFRPIFRSLSRAAVKSEEDARRLIALGVSPDKVRVLGSSKVDTLVDRADPQRAMWWRERLQVPTGVPVMVAGSLRGREGTDLLQVFATLKASTPNLLGIFAPRHLDRVPVLWEWLGRQGIAYENLSSFLESGKRARSADVIVVDRIGHLFNLYALGDLVFCGGSLVPVGGHNILEPVAWGKAVFYGPHLDSVLEEHEILSRSGVGICVSSREDLRERWMKLLEEPERLGAHRRRALAALQEMAGVADRQVAVLLHLLERRHAGPVSEG